MRTKYVIDDFQQTYFVIDSFETLLTECYQDFAPIYQRLRTASDFEANELVDADEVLHKGTLDYFRNR
jgi:phenylalanine-4-hydroxylase